VFARSLTATLLVICSPGEARLASTQDGCLHCHSGIEAMHPEAQLSCVDCHGGDGQASTIERAHVAAPATRIEDERLPPLDRDLAWVQFHNPGDLRVVKRTCGTCHEREVEYLRASLHGTTAGHLSDGYYEVGALEERGSRYAVFAQSGAPRSGGEVERLVQVPGFRPRTSGAEQLSAHYGDLPRKECLQCHLWSDGRAVRGRVGFDGDYRGSGCSACHVAYALDGLSRSADRSAVRSEPGHPEFHRMTAAPTTQACTSCHYGDASIGLHFRGLSQLPPNAPGGPQIPGTTDELLNRVFYLDDPSICPPDVHHERGMHCIDCHTASDVMGDGRLHGNMEYAVEITCSTCHGTLEEVSTLRTERGNLMTNLSWDGEQVWLRGKVDGVPRVVPQVVHVLDPLRPEYNAEAALAMTPEHAGIECYTCHAGWNANFLGFHFSRHQQLSQLDLLSGRRTPGRVTTQEKVYSTWKSFYAGLNERGSIAPYLTGFSTMGSVWDEDGKLVLDQVLPETAAGLSGMTMIHHQPHSTRPTARSCVECHRAPTTWGLGSANFRLARQLAFVADRRGIEVVAVERGEPARSAVLTKFPLPDVVDLEVRVDDLQGHARFLLAAEGGAGVHVLDMRDPTHPVRTHFVASVNPRGIELRGDHLYVADGVGGLRLLELSADGHLERTGSLPTLDAHDVEVQWPWAYVADGAGGLAVVDVRDPGRPTLLAQVDLNGESPLDNEAIVVESLFQYSRPRATEGRPIDERERARNLCAVLDRRIGLILVDVTEPTRPEVLYPPASERTRSRASPASYRGLVLLSQTDLAEPQGGETTAEHDYAYVLREQGRGQNESFVLVLDVSDATRVGRVRARIGAGFSPGQLVAADYYDPPLRRRILFTPGERGVYLAEVTTSREPRQVGALPAILRAYAVAVEEFPLDRMVTESGQRLKDVSHEGSRWLERPEIERILGVEAERLGILAFYREGSGGFLADARAAWTRRDVDHSGFLEGAELDGAEGLAEDDDGRVGLLEFARAYGGLEASEFLDVEDSAGPVEDGELARLLDGTSPYEFDRDRDGRLSRPEAERAFHAALDLDGDGTLSLDEQSRQPGPTRDLRWGTATGGRGVRSRLGRGDYHLPDELWRQLDTDGDGRLGLVAPDSEAARARGLVLPGSEWPGRRSELVLLPPGVTTDRIMEVFDRDADDVLTTREMKSRMDLFEVLDQNRDRRVERAEVERLIQRISERGVDVLADDFVGRWDLDGSGEIGPEELAESARVRLGLR
jgi:hypothetical protein